MADAENSASPHPTVPPRPVMPLLALPQTQPPGVCEPKANWRRKETGTRKGFAQALNPPVLHSITYTRGYEYSVQKHGVIGVLLPRYGTNSGQWPRSARVKLRVTLYTVPCINPSTVLPGSARTLTCPTESRRCPLRPPRYPGGATAGMGHNGFGRKKLFSLCLCSVPIGPGSVSTCSPKRLDDAHAISTPYPHRTL